MITKEMEFCRVFPCYDNKQIVCGDCEDAQCKQQVSRRLIYLAFLVGYELGKKKVNNMRREINPDTLYIGGDIHIQDKSCPGVCLKIFKGAEEPEQCPFYDPKGSVQLCIK